MIGLMSDNFSPTGVYIDARNIAAAQLIRRSGNWRLAAIGYLPRTNGTECIMPDEVRQLKGMLERVGFKGNRVALGVPDGRLLTGVFDLPPRSSGAPVEELAGEELAQMHNYDVELAQSFFWDIPPSTQAKEATQVMAVACRHADAESMMGPLEKAGFDVVALVCQLEAIQNACESKLCPSAVTGILHLGWECASLGLIYKSKVVYQRTFTEGGMKALVQLTAQRLGVAIDLAESLIQETVSQFCGQKSAAADASGDAFAWLLPHLKSIHSELEAPFTYIAKQYPGTALGRLLTVGPGARLPAVAGYLRERLKVDVQIVRPLDVIGTDGVCDGRCEDPMFVPAMGLARIAA
jgi:Tfp pilus assembly PilM family ATPase